MAQRGYRVFAGVRQPSDVHALQAQSSEINPILLDLTDGAQIAAAAETVRREVGNRGLAGLVNNAGIVVAGPLEIVPIEQLRRQFEVNVVGLVAVSQAMLPMLRLARGRIVNMSSLNGCIASPYISPYAASKHALEAISDALRVELRRWGIRVVLIEPGATRTPIWGKSMADAAALIERAGSAVMSLYRADLEAMQVASKKMADAALPVESVVRCVVHALTARYPKTRYPVGLRVNLLCRAHKWVPSPVWDWIVRRSLGLPK